MPEPTELLTWDEICDRFPDRWVAVIECDFVDGTHDQLIKSGRVVGHAAHHFALKPGLKGWPSDEPEPPGPVVIHDFTGAVYTYPHGVITCYFPHNSTRTTA